jgi:hypothetical protein
VRVKPCYDQDLWNCRSITVEEMPRTTNSCESWHNAFQGAFTSHHPNPNKLVDALLNEQVRADFLWVKLETSELPPLYANSATKEQNDNLLSVINDYNPNELGKFLKHCSMYIHLGN